MNDEVFFQVWKNRFELTVRSILGSDTPKVTSSGTSFYNQDRWTVRMLISSMCGWSQNNLSKTPTPDDVGIWVKKANKEKVLRHINIASMDYGKTSDGLYALMGGAYHEAFHTKYTLRRMVTTKEVATMIISRWGENIHWHKYLKGLLQWNNIVEDIRIERAGNNDYPGCHPKMVALQDFILKLEAGKPATSAAGVVVATFRDIGLGYKSALQTESLLSYERNFPIEYSMVTNGPLKKILDEASAPDLDAFGSLRLAMDIVRLTLDLQSDQQDFNMDMGGSDSEDEVIGNNGTPSLENKPPKKGKKKSLMVVLQSGAEGLLDIGTATEMMANANQEITSDGRPWCPWTTDKDKIIVVKPSGRPLPKVSTESSYIATRLRNLLRARDADLILHGTPRGGGLSGRRMVETVANLRAGRAPETAFYKRIKKVDTSLAVCVLSDHSGSMKSKSEDALAAAYTIATAVDGAGGALLCVGFEGELTYPKDIPVGHHRATYVDFHMYKEFHERLASVKNRFTNYPAHGTTPLCDGIQFSMQRIKSRKENHKIIFAVTDGKPNSGTEDVIKWQEIICKKMGITLIGVGVGMSSRDIMKIFERHVWVDDFKSLPKELIKVIESVVCV